MHRSEGENHPHKMKYIHRNLNTMMRLIEINYDFTQDFLFQKPLTAMGILTKLTNCYYFPF